MRPTKTFDKESVKLNLAKLKKGGENFEIIIEPEKIIDYKNKKSIDIREVLRYEKIFSDAKKGFIASENRLQALFQTQDPIKISEIILNEGEIQFTQEYRDKILEEKKK